MDVVGLAYESALTAWALFRFMLVFARYAWHDWLLDGKPKSGSVCSVTQKADFLAFFFARDFALELRKGQHHIEHQPAHGRRGIDLLRGVA